jgi:signal peptidase I
MDGTKTCPECAEDVKGAANVCRFCGHRFARPEVVTTRGELQGAPTSTSSAPLAPPPGVGVGERTESPVPPPPPVPPRSAQGGQVQPDQASRRPVPRYLGPAVIVLEALSVVLVLIAGPPAGVVVLLALVLSIIRLVRRSDARGIVLLVSVFVVPPLVGLLVVSSVVTTARVPSGSMLPTLKVGDRVVANRLGSPSLDDIVVFHPPKGADDTGVSQCGDPQVPADQACDRPTAEKSSVNFIKRVVGLPGDRIVVRGGHVIRNGKREKDDYIAPCGGGDKCDLPKRITIPPDHYFMMGDNRGESDDSRYWGPVPKDWISGAVVWRNGPFSRIGSP